MSNAQRIPADVDRANTRAASAAAAAASAATAAAPAVTAPLVQSPAGTVASNPKYKALLDKFISRLPERVAMMSRLMQDQNLVELERAVHQLKGAGHGYGYTGITEIAARAEQRIRAKADVAAVKAEVDELIRLIRSVQGYDPRREAAPAAATAVAVAPASPTSAVVPSPQHIPVAISLAAAASPATSSAAAPPAEPPAAG
jgi:HPt (histidine-containing phosphotransfer) domain-containing protein